MRRQMGAGALHSGASGRESSGCSGTLSLEPPGKIDMRWNARFRLFFFLNYIGENMEQALFSSEKMDWETPQELFEALNREFDFTIDLAASPSNAKCSRFYTAKENALEKNWEGETAFLNPPYGRDCWKWIQKAYSESQKPNTVIVLLIAARTSNKEWHEYIFPKAKEIRFIRGRLKFTTNAKKISSAPFPSAIVVFAKHTGCTEIKTM